MHARLHFKRVVSFLTDPWNRLTGSGHAPFSLVAAPAAFVPGDQGNQRGERQRSCHDV